MFIKHARMLLPGLALLALLVGLSGCTSQQAAVLPGSGNMPDQVQITMHPVNPAEQKPAMTLTEAALVRQLYTTTVGLALLPDDAMCTLEMGPSYTLTFLQGGKTLTTVNAQHYGCGDVLIAGETQNRQANQGFWSQLNQAISQATPVALHYLRSPTIVGEEV